MVEAYCLRCKKKVETKDATERVTKNNMRVLAAKCSVCGTNVSKILGKVK